MAVSELGWATLAQAEAYFIDERLVTTVWDALASNDIKNMALNMAYNRIYYCADFATPVAGTETAAQKIILIKAQSEMAYYLAVHLAAEDRRKGIQAQGVIHAGIVKEVYDKDMLEKIPIPPAVAELLEDMSLLDAMVMLPIDRDEDEDLATDVVEED